MEKEDFRTLAESGRLAIRRCAIKMIESGMLKKEVAKLFEVRPSTITAWSKAYQEKGYAGLKSKKPGVKSADVKVGSNFSFS